MADLIRIVPWVEDLLRVVLAEDQDHRGWVDRWEVEREAPVQVVAMAEVWEADLGLLVRGQERDR